jgi:hypothetical protein
MMPQIYYNALFFSVVLSLSTTQVFAEGNEQRQLRGLPASRGVLESVLCRVTMVDTMYVSADDSSSRDEQISCIPIVDELETDDVFPVNLPQDIVDQHKGEIETGTLFISIANAELTEDDLLTTEESEFSVVTDRRLQAIDYQWKSKMTVAIVRISRLILRRQIQGPL